jgi:hypothetical protein
MSKSEGNASHRSTVVQCQIHARYPLDNFTLKPTVFENNKEESGVRTQSQVLSWEMTLRMRYRDEAFEADDNDSGREPRLTSFSPP